MFFWSFARPFDLVSDQGTNRAGGAVRKTIPFENGELKSGGAIASRPEPRQRGYLCFALYGNADRAERWPAAEAEMWSDRAVEIWG